MSQFETIPKELCELPQWVCWRIVQRDGKPTTLVFPEGESTKILKAAHIIREEGIAEPILLGNEQVVLSIDPRTQPMIAMSFW